VLYAVTDTGLCLECFVEQREGKGGHKDLQRKYYCKKSTVWLYGAVS
jgi:hypothetical protein